MGNGFLTFVDDVFGQDEETKTSVWMMVFEEEKEVRKALIEAFPGTERGCFDEMTKPVRRQDREL